MAGFAGLISAHRYLCLHPTASIIILDRNVHVGGNWSYDRIYPNFYAQIVTGLAEYSDLKMREPAKDECVGDCFKADCMAKYLEEFADTMVHDGKSLRDRVRRTEVVHVTKHASEGNGCWRLLCRDIEGNEDKSRIATRAGETYIDVGITGKRSTRVVTAGQLVVAAGEFSIPNIPHIRQQSEFEAPIIHSTNFGNSNILAVQDIRHVAILGAGKSAADMLYTCLKSLPPSTQIHWIIREDGTGPGFFAPIDMRSPYRNTVEAANTMAMSLLQPSIFHDDGWWVWFFHRTWIGIWIVTWLFGQIDIEAKRRAGYSTREGSCRDRGFHKLEYNPGIFWMSGVGGALHHNDFWDLVASRVFVQRAHITHMSSHTLHLSNDSHVACDALLLGTGWTSSLSIFSRELKAELGLPYEPDVESQQDLSMWHKLDSEADALVAAQYPILASPPPHHLRKAHTTPYRLYRGIVPINDPSRSIVFINFLLSGNLIMNAEAQAMWAVAYLTSSSSLCLPSVQMMQDEVATRVAWCKRRYLSTGQLGNFLGFDSILYTSLLLKDLSVDEPWRAKGTWGVRRPGDLGKAWKLFAEKQRYMQAKMR
jgi:dimethylaniline monooxygenase (N-oxide forming)